MHPAVPFLFKKQLFCSKEALCKVCSYYHNLIIILGVKKLLRIPSGQAGVATSTVQAEVRGLEHNE